MGPDPRAAFRQCCGHLALRDAKQQADEIDAGKICIHRFDQSRIAVDQKRRVAVIAQNIIDAQSAVPGELLADRREVSAHLQPAHALLDGLAAANAGGNLPIGMEPD